MKSWASAFRKPVEILDHAVVIEDGQLAGLEAHGHEVVVLLLPRVGNALPGFLCPHEGCGRRAMVSVGNIEAGHPAELLGNEVYVLRIGDHPEPMAEAVDGRHEVILGLGSGITHEKRVEHGIVGIGKEYGFNVGIAHAHVLHAVFFLVPTGQLVLLDDAREIVVHTGSDHEAVLRPPVHGLGIDIIMLCGILHEPASLLEKPEMVGGTLVDARVVLGRAGSKVDFGFDDVIERFLVVAGLGAGLFGIEHVVGTRLHQLHEVLGGTDAPKRFDCSHSIEG